MLQSFTWVKNYTLISLCLFCSDGLKAQYLQWNDVLEKNSSTPSVISEASFNNSNDLFISGYFNGGIDLDPNTNAAFSIYSSSTNSFLARYDESGDFLFGAQLWGKQDVRIKASETNLAGSIFVAAEFNDSIDLNLGNGKAYYSIGGGLGSIDAIMVKYNQQGVFQWARQLVSNGYTKPSTMTLDQSGNIVVGGTFKGNTDFDPGSGVQSIAAVDKDIFIAKYNTSGHYVKAIKIGPISSGSGFQEVFDMESDGNGNIYVSGRFEGSVDFDPGAGSTFLNSNGANDLFLAKYNSSLQLQWAYRLGGPKTEGRIQLELYNNEIYLSGSFQDSIDADLKTGTNWLIGNGGLDVFYAKYNLSGNLQNSFSFGGQFDDEFKSIDVYNSDSILLSGQFKGTVDFDPTNANSSLTSGLSKTLFFAAYSNNGKLNWASKVNGSGDAEVNMALFDKDGHPYILGQFTGNANFNEKSNSPFNFNGPGAFIAKYESCGSASITTTTQDANCGISDGSATAIISGGTAPYRYFWTSGDLAATADSLRSGMYYLTVIDTNNCSYYSDPVLINEIGGPTVSLSAKTDVTCHGGNNGAIVINVSGGSVPYDYSWSNGSLNQNLNNLSKGSYEVTVTDNDNCKSHLRVGINEADEMKVYSAVTKPSCNSSNGSVTAVVTGGQPTYNYSWIPSGSGNTLSSISSGVYTVTVTDANNCSVTKSMAVSDNNAPDIYLDSLFESSCSSGGGGIYISVYGGMPSYNYNWSPGGFTSQDISGVQPVEYKLVVTDQSLCKAVFIERIEAEKPKTPEICIVDVDSVNGNAVLVWEKPTTRGSIDYYNIFRETSVLNSFNLIEDSIEFSELSLYEDKFADTWTRPWSYKISTTDTCGITSNLSPSHTTIHTVVTKNAQQEFNILWSPYKGNFQVLQYSIFRYTDSTGTVDSLTSVPANIFTYTDKNSPSKGEDVYYFIKTYHPTGCTATEAQNKNSSRSNRGGLSPPPDFLGVKQNTVFKQAYSLFIKPNPSNGLFDLKLNILAISNAEMTIYNLQGQQVLQENFEVNKHRDIYSFNASSISNGMYLLVVKIGNEVHQGRIIISKN